LIGGTIYVILMAVWIIPKYQSYLKGNLVKGYIADEVKEMFSETKAADTSIGKSVKD
jgi:NCS1 family nucleobase:cation symporter-1